MADCRVCGGAFRKTFSRGQSQYGCCARCGTVNKILTEEEYWSLDPTYDPGELIHADEAAILDRIGVEGKTRFLSKLLRTSSVKTGDLKLLDVGCGVGGYLLAARALGMAAQGVEPSESHSRIGRERFGLDITTGYFVPGEVSQRFDIIILSHVIEHIYEPAEFMAGLATALAPGGVLVVITPNATSPLAVMSGPAWSMLAPTDHVTMLGPRGIQKIAPPGHDCSWRTDEYIWEPAATLLVAIRNQLRRTSASGVHASNNAVQAEAGNRALDNRLIKFALSVVSAPFWVAFSAFRCGACLVAEYRSPQADAMQAGATPPSG